jgi:Ca2+-dependent lipid-binding protein
MMQQRSSKHVVKYADVKVLVTLYVRPMLKLKIKVIDDNLSREWNETFELLVKYKETQSVIFEGYDEDNLQQDKRLGVAKLAVNNIQPETPSEITLKLMQSLDSLKIKDYGDRGSLHLKVRVGILFSL